MVSKMVCGNQLEAKNIKISEKRFFKPYHLVTRSYFKTFPSLCISEQHHAVSRALKRKLSSPSAEGAGTGTGAGLTGGARFTESSTETRAGAGGLAVALAEATSTIVASMYTVVS
jgi:hypothetical protein